MKNGLKKLLGTAIFAGGMIAFSPVALADDTPTEQCDGCGSQNGIDIDAVGGNQNATLVEGDDIDVVTTTRTEQGQQQGQQQGQSLQNNIGGSTYNGSTYNSEFLSDNGQVFSNVELAGCLSQASNAIKVFGVGSLSLGGSSNFNEQCGEHEINVIETNGQIQVDIINAQRDAEMTIMIAREAIDNLDALGSRGVQAWATLIESSGGDNGLVMSAIRRTSEVQRNLACTRFEDRTGAEVPMSGIPGLDLYLESEKVVYERQQRTAQGGTPRVCGG